MSKRGYAANDPIWSKPCVKCGSPDRNSFRDCRPCHSAADKAWREANPDKGPAASKAWYAANPDRARAGQKVWREANRERKLAGQKAWREAKKALTMHSHGEIE